jgi:small acid-soluble spore protein B (major beta-type SASP)
LAIKKIHKQAFFSQTMFTKEVKKMPNNNSSNQLVVPGAQQALDQMKYEIAQEFGVQLGPDSTARANGSVGGEITKRLVQMAEQQFGGYQQ